MTYVLVLMLTYGSGAMMTVPNFRDEQACKQAGEVFLQGPKYYRAYSCLPHQSVTLNDLLK